MLSAKAADATAITMAIGNTVKWMPEGSSDVVEVLQLLFFSLEEAFTDAALEHEDCGVVALLATV